MKKRNKKNIWIRMYDVRPTEGSENSHFRKTLGSMKDSSAEKVRKIKTFQRSGGSHNADQHRIFTDIIRESRERYGKKKIKGSFRQTREPHRVSRLGQFYKSEEVPIFHESELHNDNLSFSDDGSVRGDFYGEELSFQSTFQKNLKSELVSFDEFLLSKHFNRLRFKKTVFSFFSVASAILLLIFGIGFIHKGLDLKKSVLRNGDEAYANLDLAKEGMLNSNFEKSETAFTQAREDFSEISSDIDGMGKFFVEVSRYVPFASKISSGNYLARAGKDISEAGIISSRMMQTLGKIRNPLEPNGEPISFLKIFQESAADSQQLLSYLEDAENNLSKVNPSDIPSEKRTQFVALKNKLPEIRRFIGGFLSNSYIFTDILGGNGPRKYLFLFQNNQEMRATGGFIGSYGALDITNGRVKKFFIDGIFNPDGQLREKIVPPAPIQKISAAWSLHDSNWFPDFPVSAEKAALFYEKTGGPTVDGVIAMTPTVMQKLLFITGPIELPEYEVTVDKDNFVEKIQYEVEIDYDKEENKPKQILADLAPKILDKIFNTQNLADITRTMDVLIDSLSERQIVIYSKNYDIEKKLSEVGWSGEILDTDRDYISVINTNINGFKTDGVVDETIEHDAEIQTDGSIIDTITVTRRHNGGDTAFDWWNKVNADYMRVYVPKGSKLLSAEGQTREFASPPLDYDSLNFKRDPQVQSEEESTEIDEDSGTRIYDDAGKTVFANWVYVSPKETVTIKYKYLLPFRISINNNTRPADTYSLLAQKQAGSRGSKFISHVKYPDRYKMIWRYPDETLKSSNNSIDFEAILEKDKFIGIALSSSSL